MDDVTAVLLCGGKGERLRPFTESLPKPLVTLAGRPLLEHLLAYLSAAGVKRFVLCTGYKREAIEAFAASYIESGWNLRCVDSGEASMTDRVLDARRHATGRVLVCYGDTLANVDIKALTAQHEASGAFATLTVYPLHSPFGIVEIDSEGLVTAFREKPALPYWINIGFLLCEQRALDRLRRGSDMVEFLSDLASERTLGTHRHSGRHLTVNTEKERADAENQIEFFTLLGGTE